MRESHSQTAPLSNRLERLEEDMKITKTHQQAHDCQIDTLALEVHDFRSEFDAFKTEMNEFKLEMYEFRAEMRMFKNSVKARFNKVDEKLDIIIEALAL